MNEKVIRLWTGSGFIRLRTVHERTPLIGCVAPSVKEYSFMDRSIKEYSFTDRIRLQTRAEPISDPGSAQAESPSPQVAQRSVVGTGG